MKPTPVINNSHKLLVSSAMFASGWFGLSFSFPLLATSLHYGYSFTGFLGFMGSFPFPVIAFIYLKSNRAMLRYGRIIPYFILAFLSALFVIYSKSEFIEIIILADIAQGFWWISMEIALNLITGSNNAEKYSIGWGIPNAVIPIASGFIIQFLGFDALFIVATAFFLLGLLFIPSVQMEKTPEKFNKVKMRFVIPLLFAGVTAGFLYYVFVPVLRNENMSYGIIGALVSVYSISSAAGYIILNFLRNLRIRSYSILSSVFLLSAFFIIYTRNIFFLALILIMVGIGASISMSKILSYISSTSSPRLGVFYYETFFGIGFTLGSFILGTIYEYAGPEYVSILFLFPLAYMVYESAGYFQGRRVSA
ncbi:hypothetical protein OXIME_001019 [Oxyplasma meridianum]|uniref:MFS transporter n=1 Tax=Oxyplasma meridianum TaxID=3073602 RepID=A0AAX4NGR2_9ARCH